ncbi:hypothetical protein NN561_018118 [Cricetulus griseus]
MHGSPCPSNRLPPPGSFLPSKHSCFPVSTSPVPPTDSPDALLVPRPHAHPHPTDGSPDALLAPPPHAHPHPTDGSRDALLTPRPHAHPHPTDRSPDALLAPPPHAHPHPTDGSFHPSFQPVHPCKDTHTQEPRAGAGPPSSPFLSSVSPPSLPPPKGSRLPGPGLFLTSFGHLSGANRFIQENRSNHVPEGAAPRVRALPGHPPQREPCAHARTHRIPRGRGSGNGARVLTPASDTDLFAAALRHFGFPRTTGAFWERGATPRPNGSSPGPQRGGDCAASAEEHRVLRLGPVRNKEGLFNVAAGLSAAAAGSDTIVSERSAGLQTPLLAAR